jgi:hypothetical protein
MDAGAAREGVRALVWEWDPIGVSGIVPRPVDEYDCLIGPLLRSLAQGADRTEIGEFLSHELEDHFGLDPGRFDVVGVAGGIVDWWVSTDRSTTG